jgi:hypothetical protein
MKKRSLVTIAVVLLSRSLLLAEAPAKTTGTVPAVHIETRELAVADIDQLQLHPFLPVTISFSYAGSSYEINITDYCRSLSGTDDPQLATAIALLSGIQRASKLSFEAQSLPGKPNEWVVYPQKFVLHFDNPKLPVKP